MSSLGGRPKWANTLALAIGAFAFGLMKVNGLFVVPIGGRLGGAINALLIVGFCHAVVWLFVPRVRQEEDDEAA